MEVNRLYYLNEPEVFGESDFFNWNEMFRDYTVNNIKELTFYWLFKPFRIWYFKRFEILRYR